MNPKDPVTARRPLLAPLPDRSRLQVVTMACGGPGPAKPLAKPVAVSASGGVTAAPIAQHCSSVHGGEESACLGHTRPNLKQRRNVRLLAELTGEVAPPVDEMSFSEVDQWIARAWRAWMAQPAGK